MAAESHYQTDWTARLEEAVNTASQAGIEIEYHDLSDADIPVKSGHCRIRGRDLIILDRALPAERQVEFLVHCLRQFDLESYYIPAWLRERLESTSAPHDPAQ
jgi:hypothetical protein